MKPTLTVLKHGMLRYRYTAGGCMDFDFNTLAEVGQPYQKAFLDLIEKRRLKIEFSRNIDEKPWVADFVVKEEPK